MSKNKIINFRNYNILMDAENDGYGYINIDRYILYRYQTI